MAFKRVEVPKKKPGPGWWSDKTRMECVSAFVLLGKVSLVVATTGIPEDTVRKWKMTQWWKDAEDEIRRSTKLTLSSKLTDIVNKTMVALDDRVTNGDYVWDRDSKSYGRKPITGLMASKIASDMLDRALLLESKASQEKVSEEGINDRLDRIREQLRSLTSGNNAFYDRPPPEIIEADVVIRVPITLEDLKNDPSNQVESERQHAANGSTA